MSDLYDLDGDGFLGPPPPGWTHKQFLEYLSISPSMGGASGSIFRHIQFERKKWGADSNGDGIWDVFDPDGNGIVNTDIKWFFRGEEKYKYMDLNLETYQNDGSVSGPDPSKRTTDLDGNGIRDFMENVTNSTSAVTVKRNVDLDGDGVPDLNIDRDGDGEIDDLEAPSTDADGDGIIDIFDRFTTVREIDTVREVYTSDPLTGAVMPNINNLRQFTDNGFNPLKTPRALEITSKVTTTLGRDGLPDLNINLNNISTLNDTNLDLDFDGEIDFFDSWTADLNGDGVKDKLDSGYPGRDSGMNGVVKYAVPHPDRILGGSLDYINAWFSGIDTPGTPPFNGVSEKSYDFNGDGIMNFMAQTVLDNENEVLSKGAGPVGVKMNHQTLFDLNVGPGNTEIERRAQTRNLGWPDSDSSRMVEFLGPLTDANGDGALDWMQPEFAILMDQSCGNNVVQGSRVNESSNYTSAFDKDCCLANNGTSSPLCCLQAPNVHCCTVNDPVNGGWLEHVKQHPTHACSRMICEAHEYPNGRRCCTRYNNEFSYCDQYVAARKLKSEDSEDYHSYSNPDSDLAAPHLTRLLQANTVNLMVYGAPAIIRTELCLKRHPAGEEMNSVVRNPNSGRKWMADFVLGIYNNYPPLVNASSPAPLSGGHQGRKMGGSLIGISLAEDFQQTPDIAKFDAGWMSQKPWCDYSTLTGSPGKPEIGVEKLTGRSSIFCDGIHDGNLVVNAAGFSDPGLVPPKSNMTVLVRPSSFDGKTAGRMEIRKINRVYQWQFPRLDPSSTGNFQVYSNPKMANRVGLWNCAFEKFSDGICDANCGRPDWDCMGELGSPKLFLENELDLDSTLIVFNCPEGLNKIVPVPEIKENGTQMAPTCKAIRDNPSLYKYSEFGTGLPTSVREKHYKGTYLDGTPFDGSQNQKAAQFLSYLWEVIELDRPLIGSRDPGTIVETLGINAEIEEKYLSANRPNYVGAISDTAGAGVAGRRLDAVTSSSTSSRSLLSSVAAPNSMFIDPNFENSHQGSVSATTVAERMEDAETTERRKRKMKRVEEIRKEKLRGREERYESKRRKLSLASKHDISETAIVQTESVSNSLPEFMHPHLSSHTIDDTGHFDFHTQNSPSGDHAFGGSSGKCNVDRLPSSVLNLRPQKAINKDSEFDLDDDESDFDTSNTPRTRSLTTSNTTQTQTTYVSGLQDAVPAKRVISSNVATIQSIALNRAATSSYLPNQRWQPTVREPFTSPDALDLDIAIFVMPERLELNSLNPSGALSLCPNIDISGESITNEWKLRLISDEEYMGAGSRRRRELERRGLENKIETIASTNSSSSLRSRRHLADESDAIGAALFSQWAIHPEDNFRVDPSSCKLNTFDSLTLSCKDSSQLKELSSNKWRQYCASDMPPQNIFEFAIRAPLTSNWLLPSERTSEGYQDSLPEWKVDLETSFHLSFDQDFLDIEREFMGGKHDYVNGQRRYWAAEQLMKGQARCNSAKISECSVPDGAPANPPSARPSVVIRVNRARAHAVVDAVDAKYWPEDRDTREELFDQLDKQAKINILGALQGLSSAVDGYFSLQPMSRVILRVTWMISAVYKETKLGGSYELKRYVANVRDLGFGFEYADKTQRSVAKIRVQFLLDPMGCLRYRETPELTLLEFLTKLGAWMGYFSLGFLVLACWQKYMKPFGLVDNWTLDDIERDFSEKRIKREIYQMKHGVRAKKFRKKEIDEWNEKFAGGDIYSTKIGPEAENDQCDIPGDTAVFETIMLDDDTDPAQKGEPSAVDVKGEEGQEENKRASRLSTNSVKPVKSTKTVKSTVSRKSNKSVVGPASLKSSESTITVTDSQTAKQKESFAKQQSWAAARSGTRPLNMALAPPAIPEDKKLAEESIV